MATNKELYRWWLQAKNCVIGYCCQQETRNKLIELGTNSGYYGWNWTAYLDIEENTLYISNYRNVPKYITEK